MIRNLFTALVKHLDKKEFTIIVGARQTGKSTLMKQLFEYCQKQDEPCIFLNLENQNILTELNQSPLNIFPYFPDATQKTTVFIDEIQYLKDPSNFLKLLYDDYSEKIKIVATGSSAFYIDASFKDSLAGRKKIFWLQTCSFDEYLQLADRQDLWNEIIRIRKNAKAKSAKINLLRQEWENYMLYGGYPAVAAEPNREEKIAYLTDLRDSFLKKDILESGVLNESAFYKLFRLLAAQSGSLVNGNELSITLRIKHDTVSNYLYILQKCFHGALVKPFYRNLRKELTKMPKVYLLDTGMQNCLLNNFQPLELRQDKGMIWETMYYKLLCERYAPDDILFWRTSDGNEIDFVLPNIETPFAVEIKYDEALIKESKYKKFVSIYPEIPLSFQWLNPFNEDFFRRILPVKFIL